jgi:hypothetical protein
MSSEKFLYRLPDTSAWSPQEKQLLLKALSGERVEGSGKANPNFKRWANSTESLPIDTTGVIE